MSQHASPTECIIRMMRAFPGLYPTRAEALEWLFTHSDLQWQDGCLVIPEGELSGTGTWPNDNVWTREQALSQTREVNARCLRQIAAEEVVALNAPIFAAEEYSRFDGNPTHDPVNLDTMPADVRRDWREAADEFCRLVVAHQWEPTSPRSAPDYENREKERFEQVKTKCRRFLAIRDVLPPSAGAAISLLRDLTPGQRALALKLLMED